MLKIALRVTENKVAVAKPQQGRQTSTEKILMSKVRDASRASFSPNSAPSSLHMLPLLCSLPVLLHYAAAKLASNFNVVNRHCA